MRRRTDDRAPEGAIRRLSIYRRCLEGAVEAGRSTVSSAALARMAGVTAAQLRRDLACFGRFGVRGRGYDAAALAGRLRRILGTDRTWPVVIVGAGPLGTALASYRGFARNGIRIAALFDVDPSKIGTRRGGIEVLPMEGLGRFVRGEGVRIAILAVPADAAEAAGRALAEAGVEAVLNFAPAHLDLPRGVRVRHVDLAVDLEAITHRLAAEEAHDSARRRR